MIQRQIEGTEVLLFSDSRCEKSTILKKLLTANDTYFNSIDLNLVDVCIRESFITGLKDITGFTNTP